MSALLSITAQAPVFNQTNDTFHERLQTENEQITSVWNKGFNTAKFTLTGDLDYLRDWYTNGFVRDIEWTGPFGELIWSGFVSKLALTEGENTREKDLNSFANRVVAFYRSQDTGTNPVTINATTSVTVNNTSSQAIYGIKVLTASAGEATTAQATAYANSLLSEVALIQPTEKINPGGAAPRLEVTMSGYSDMVDWYNYTNESDGTLKADVTVKNILSADPNGIVSSDFTDIDSSPTDIAQAFEGKDRGWKAIQQVAEYGDSSTGYFWVASIYEDKRVMFKVMEGVDSNRDPRSSNKYLTLERQATDAGDRYIDQAGREVFPWSIRPDRLLYISGRRENPMYIASTSYTPPFGVTITGFVANPAL